MEPLVVRFGSAVCDLDCAIGHVEETIEAHGGRTLASWEVDDDAYAVVDVSAFIEDIDHVFSSIPVELRAGAPLFTDELWLKRLGGLDEIVLARGYHVDLPAFESPHLMAVRPYAVLCPHCFRIGHRGPPCPGGPE
jgi:hypothetical protein